MCPAHWSAKSFGAGWIVGGDRTMAGLGLSDLRAAAAVATHRSFRAAAAELEMSPSSLSHTVASLERTLGVRLFERTTRSVVLTEAGAGFLERVRPALQDIVDAVGAVDRPVEAPLGLLRLSASETGAQRILPLLLGFMAAHPEVRVDLVTDSRMVDIVAEGFDAGVRIADEAPQDMATLPLGSHEQFAVVASPRYFAGRPPPKAPADLFAHDCIRTRMPSGALQRWAFERGGQAVKIDPPGRLVVGNADLALQAARAAAGFAYVPYRAVGDDLTAGKLIRVLVDWTPEFPGACLYYPARRLGSPALRALVDYFETARRRA